MVDITYRISCTPENKEKVKKINDVLFGEDGSGSSVTFDEVSGGIKSAVLTYGLEFVNGVLDDFGVPAGRGRQGRYTLPRRILLIKERDYEEILDAIALGPSEGVDDEG